MNNDERLSKGLHDCTSSLTVVLGYLQMLQKELSINPSIENKKYLKYVTEATNACSNIHNIIQEIKPQ